MRPARNGYDGSLQSKAKRAPINSRRCRANRKHPPNRGSSRHSYSDVAANVATAERSPGLLSIRPSPLVGRDDIREALQTACREAIQGQGPAHRLIILVGPAGVGKSRIAEWLYESVHESGSMVPLRARYRSPRGPLDGMLGAVTQYFNFERADRDTLERTLLARWKIGRNDKAGRTWVAGIAEWLRPLGPISDQPIGPSGIRFSLDTPETRRMVMRYTLRRIARGRPMLLWLDDLHHASESTIAGLAHLHEEEADQRFVMTATIRDEDYRLDPQLAEKLRPLFEKIDTRILEVRPMDSETTCALVRASLPLDDAAVEEAARRSRGNPLFALQQLHAWALAGEMTRVAGRYHVPAEVLAVRPRTTAELWDSRIAALPAEHRLAPFAAASLGADVRRVVLHSLLTALELPADEAILSMQNAEILVPRGPGRYGWPHALLYEHLSSRLAQRDDSRRILRAASDALSKHPLAATRRVVRQRVSNLLGAGDPDAAANVLFCTPSNLRRRGSRTAILAVGSRFTQGQASRPHVGFEAPLASRSLPAGCTLGRSQHARRDCPGHLRGIGRFGEPGPVVAIARLHYGRTGPAASRLEACRAGACDFRSYWAIWRGWLNAKPRWARSSTRWATWRRPARTWNRVKRTSHLWRSPTAAVNVCCCWALSSRRKDRWNERDAEPRRPDRNSSGRATVLARPWLIWRWLVSSIGYRTITAQSVTRRTRWRLLRLLALFNTKRSASGFWH